MLPNYFDLENQRSELIERTLNTSSGILRCFHFYKYFSIILEYKNQKLEEAFLKEFIDDYLSALSKFEIWGIDPLFTKQLIVHLEELKNTPIISDNEEALSSDIIRLKDQLNYLLLILDGKEIKEDPEPKARFPLIDKDNKEGFYGIIDSVTVRINKAATENKFIIVPSAKDSDQRIIEQCRISWQLALTRLIHYVRKPYRYHEVIINFEKQEGFYEGNSLGIALTISFLNQLLKFYNPIYSINIAPWVAFTGAVTEKGETVSTGNQIIKQKVAAVFFSDIKTFVFPKSEESSAIKELNELKDKYPNRILKLIPAEDISDILNRRDIVDIKKRNIILRTGKFVKKNWAAVLVAVILTFILSYLFVLDFDDNPYLIDAGDGIINVKNKVGRILWNKRNSLSDAEINENDLQKYLVKIVDIDDDGVNEVLVTSGSRNESLNEIKENALTCFDHNGKKIWDYTIGDTIYSYRKGDEILPPPYSIQIIDTVTFAKKKLLYIFGNNRNSFSSLIFGIDLKSGKRIAGTFYSSGHILGAFIKDINNDGIKDILAKGVDNGYNQIVLFGMSLKNLKGNRKTTPDYSLRLGEDAELLFYIRLPKTDLDELQIGERFASKNMGKFWDNYTKQKIIHMSTFYMKTLKLTASAIEYQLHNNFKDFDLIIFDEFRTVRDSLVAQGKLKLPYTDTPEYKNIIKNEILYYKDGKWVKREGLD